MIALLLALILLAVLFGGRRVAAGLRGALSIWRPTAGLAAVVIFVLALVLGVREAWLPAAALLIVSLGLAVSARRRPMPKPASTSGMTRAEASAILGLSPDAGPEAVQAAYLRLIRRLHPDQGGTSGLAAQLNAARAAMMGR